MKKAHTFENRSLLKVFNLSQQQFMFMSWLRLTEKILWYKKKNSKKNMNNNDDSKHPVFLWEQRMRLDCVSVRLLGNMTHLGSDVAQQEESNSGDTTGYLCYPEGHLPAMVLGNGAKW